MNVPLIFGPLRYDKLRILVNGLSTESLSGAHLYYTLGNVRLHLEVLSSITTVGEHFGICVNDEGVNHWVWGRSRVSRWISTLQSIDKLPSVVEAIWIGRKLMNVRIVQCDHVASTPMRALVEIIKGA